MQIVIVILISLHVFMPVAVYALDQEKIDQLTQVMNIGCALGESYRIQVSGDGKILLLKKGLQGKFDASRDKTNSVINFIASDNGRRQVAEDTRNCMKRYMDRIFDAILGTEPGSHGGGIPPEPKINITGMWYDRHWDLTSEVTQQGDSYQYKVWGPSCIGGNFQSSGSGTIKGKVLESTYQAMYQYGQSSTGRCSGTVSQDGEYVQQTCYDTVCGQFISTSSRR